MRSESNAYSLTPELQRLIDERVESGRSHRGGLGVRDDFGNWLIRAA
jgi:hypothetical protein